MNQKWNWYATKSLSQLCRYYFFVLPTLYLDPELRAEIKKYFCLVFGSNEKKNICFRNLLTFKNSITEVIYYYQYRWCCNSWVIVKPQCYIQWLYIAPFCTTLRIKTWVAACFFNFFQLFGGKKNLFLKIQVEKFHNNFFIKTFFCSRKV